MQIFESALRGYLLDVPRSLIAKDRIERAKLFPATKIQAWIDEQVLPAIFSLWNRPGFRREATWAQQNFGTDPSTPAWQRVAGVASAIRDSARYSLTTAAAAARSSQFPSLANAHEIAQRGSGRLRAVESIMITGDGPPKHYKYGNLAEHDIVNALLQVESARKRRAKELVAVNDYFGPAGDSVVTIDGKNVAVAEFTAFFNPRICFLGNFIIRALLTRIDHDLNAIGRLRHAAYRELQKRKSPQLIASEVAAWNRLLGAKQDVENEWVRSPEASRCDGCMALVQIAIEWSRGTIETDWLGLPEHVLRTNRGRLTYELKAGRNYRAAEQIAQALDDVQALYANARPNESAIEEAIASGALVFVGGDVYWEGAQIGDELTPLSRRFLRRLAEMARCGQAVKDSDLKEGDGRGTMASRAQRLKLGLPRSLRNKIRPGDEPRSYKLDLRSDKVYFFYE